MLKTCKWGDRWISLPSLGQCLANLGEITESLPSNFKKSVKTGAKISPGESYNNGKKKSLNVAAESSFSALKIFCIAWLLDGSHQSLRSFVAILLHYFP